MSLGSQIPLSSRQETPEKQEASAHPDELVLSTSPEALPVPGRDAPSLVGIASRQTSAPKPELPEAFLQGVPMIKISNRKVKQRTFRIEPPVDVNAALGELVGDRRGVEGYATICWESRKIGRGEYRVAPQNCVSVDADRNLKQCPSTRFAKFAMAQLQDRQPPYPMSSLLRSSRPLQPLAGFQLSTFCHRPLGRP